jgi:WD40-like Beta Propeller Repeat
MFQRSLFGGMGATFPPPIWKPNGALLGVRGGCAVVLICLLLLIGSGDIAFAQLQEPIVYARQTTACCKYELWRANADGTTKRRIDGLTTKWGPAVEPTLSPAGDTIVFSDGVDLYKANASGSGQVKITNAQYGENHVTCSGECLNVPLEGYHDPEFAPDGTKVVFWRQDERGDHPGWNGIWAVNIDGAGLTRVVAGSYRTAEPTWSPDGQRIAFSDGSSLKLVNSDGTNLTTLSLGRSAYGPSWSPDGSAIAFGNGDIWTVRLDTGVVQQITATTVGEYEPDWAPDGSSVMFAAQTSPSQISAVNPDGTNYRTVAEDPAAYLTHGSFRSAVGSGPPPPPSAIQALTEYVPELRYDQQETYRADSAATITDNIVLDSRGRLVRRNSLRGASGGILATSYFKEKSADLSLGFLGSPTYSNGVLSSETDYLDEEGTDAEKALDAQRMHGNSNYANKIYGHVVPYSNGEIVLPYWFWYYYNSKAIAGVGLHEGDWEMVSIVLGPDYLPRRAAYAQHTGGEVCDWSHVQRTLSGRPIGYVAQDSHATYFSAGDHALDAGAVFDNADGLGGSVTPSVTILDESVSWFGWAGSWGSSGGGGLNSESPHGPGHAANADAYTDPLGWSNGISGCTEDQTFAASARSKSLRKSVQPSLARPPAPKVRVKRHGSKVAIRYRFSTWPKGPNRRPVHLLTTVDPAGNKYPPLTLRADVKTRKGRVVRPLGAGHGPFTALVSAEAKSGAVSRTVKKPLR